MPSSPAHVNRWKRVLGTPKGEWTLNLRFIEGSLVKRTSANLQCLTVMFPHSVENMCCWRWGVSLDVVGSYSCRVYIIAVSGQQHMKRRIDEGTLIRRTGELQWNVEACSLNLWKWLELACSRSSPPVAAAASGAAAAAAAAKNGVEAASVYNMATSLLSFLSHRHLTNLFKNPALRGGKKASHTQHGRNALWFPEMQWRHGSVCCGHVTKVVPL